MARILILVALVVVLVWWLLGRAGRTGRAGDATGQPRRPQPGPAQDMVACAHCGVHLPRGDAVLDGSTPYCGDEHRRLGPRGR